MSKKVLSVLVALCMMVSLFAVAANAAALIFEDLSSTNEQVWSLTEPADNGDGTYSVDVVLTTNYGVGQIQFKLQTTGTVVIEDVVNNVDDIFRIGFNKETGNVALYANTTGLEQLDAPVYDYMSIVTVTVSGAGTLAIVDDPKTADNVGGTLIASRMDNGDLVNGDPVLGQAYSFDVQEVTIGATAPTELRVIEGKNGYINTNYTTYGPSNEYTCDGYIYGVEITDGTETIADVFEVVNGSMNIVPSYLEGASDCGTGAILQVLDSSSTVVKEYVFIAFGDADGSGEVDNNDASILEYSAGFMYESAPNGMYIEDAAIIFACDILAEGDITNNNSSFVEVSAGWLYAEGADGMRMHQSDAIRLLQENGKI